MVKYTYPKLFDESAEINTHTHSLKKSLNSLKQSVLSAPPPTTCSSMSLIHPYFRGTQ